MEFSSGSAFLYGGMAGTCTTDARLSLSDCSCSGEMTFSGNCTSSWNYVGGLVGKPVSSTTSSNEGKDWRLTLERCSFTGKYIVDGGGKIRAGMLCSYANTPFVMTACTASGSLVNTCTASRDFVAASMIGFVEKNVEGKIDGCTFNGRVSSVAGANNYIGGVLGNTADNALVVCDRCSTGSSAFVGADAVKSVGMLAGRPKTAGCSVLNCRIAGTINKAGTSFVISPSNLEDWMFIGSGTTAQVTLSGNTFNNEK